MCDSVCVCVCVCVLSITHIRSVCIRSHVYKLGALGGFPGSYQAVMRTHSLFFFLLVNSIIYLSACQETATSLQKQAEDALPTATDKSVASKFIHIEEMRHRRFDPASLYNDNAHLNVQTQKQQQRTLQRGKDLRSFAQISLFKEQARARIASKLTQVFEDTKETHRAKQRAKNLVRARVEIKNAAVQRTSAAGGVEE